MAREALAGLSPHKHDRKHDLHVPAVALKYSLFYVSLFASRPLCSDCTSLAHAQWDMSRGFTLVASSVLRASCSKNSSLQTSAKVSRNARSYDGMAMHVL